MKRFMMFAALILFSMAAVAQEYQVMPEPGKKMSYEVNAVTPMGVTRMYVTQILEKTDDGKYIVNSSASTAEGVEGQQSSLTYSIADGEYVISVKEVLADQLAQMGGNLEIFEATDLHYPVALSENSELKPATMRIKVNIQGMDMDMTISIKERKTTSTEEITTPAGTFTCLKMTEKQVISLMGQEQVSEVTYWYGKGIGLVKQATVAMGGMVSTELLLKKME